MTASRGARSATCRTGRSSVTLIRSPAEHRVDPLAEAGALGQGDEQPQRLVGDAVLGVVEVEVAGLERQALAAVGVLGEQVAQVDVPQLVAGAPSSAAHSGVVG